VSLSQTRTNQLKTRSKTRVFARMNAPRIIPIIGGVKLSVERGSSSNSICDIRLTILKQDVCQQNAVNYNTRSSLSATLTSLIAIKSQPIELIYYSIIACIAIAIKQSNGLRIKQLYICASCIRQLLHAWPRRWR
jgi:hypothetical protein